jgi:hypothetical protein
MERAMMKYDKMPNVLIDGDSLLRGAPLGILNCLASSSSRQTRERYENGVYWTLETVVKTWTGWAVLKAIATTRGKKVRIVPYTAEEQKARPNALAYTRPDDERDAAPAGQVPFAGGEDDPNTPKDERFNKENYIGTGQGSDATITLDPTREDKPDSTLLHELVHALRDIRGKRNRVPAGKGGMRRFENEEEFFAYLIGSIYNSEKRYPKLTFGSAFGEVPNAWNTSQGFLRDFLNGRNFVLLIDKLNSQCGDVCTNLSLKVPVWVPFNPVREYLQNRDQYPLVGTPPWMKEKAGT